MKSVALGSRAHLTEIHMLAINRTRRAFSLIELVIVVVILGIIGAIAIPRMSRGAEGAADSSLVADLAVLRNAIDLYQAEHGGVYPPAADIEDALTLYSNIEGDDFGAKDATRIYGPYLRKVPTIKVGSAKGARTITATDGEAGAAWVYTEATGHIHANIAAGEADARGIDYRDY